MLKGIYYYLNVQQISRFTVVITDLQDSAIGIILIHTANYPLWVNVIFRFI